MEAGLLESEIEMALFSMTMTSQSTNAWSYQGQT